MTDVPSDKNLKINCFEFSINHFRLVGCWPFWHRKREWRERLNILYSGFVFTIQLTSVIILFYGLLNENTRNWNTLEEAVEDILVFVTVFIVFLKLIFLLSHQRQLQEFFQDLNRDFEDPDFLRGESPKIIKNCIKHEIGLMRLYASFGYSTTLLYTASSIVGIIRSSHSDDYHLPLKYPIHPKGYFFVFMFCFQVVAMVMTGHIGTMVDSLFSCLAFYIAGYLEILKRRAVKEAESMSKKFVLHHNEVFRLVKKFESIFGIFVTFELGVTTALLCLGMVQVTMIEVRDSKLILYIKCVIYVIGKTAQMLLYCWYGDLINQKSIQISQGAYFGTWHEAGSREKTGFLVMVMLRSQKPLIFKGYHIKVYLPTIVSIINIAYGFFTILRSLQNRGGRH